MTSVDKTCEACHGESGGELAGVASMAGAPMSIAWCRSCLEHDVTPAWMADAQIGMTGLVADGRILVEQLADWWLDQETWYDGAYVDLRTYYRQNEARIVEDALKFIAEFDLAMSVPPEDVEPLDAD